MKQGLIVDDQADIRRLVLWSVEPVAHAVQWYEATTGEEALQIAPRIRADIILLDVMLPGAFDGLEVCRQLRRLPGMSHTRILMVSARGAREDVQAGLEAGADDYFVKPFSPQRLIDAVRGALQPR